MARPVLAYHELRSHRGIPRLLRRLMVLSIVLSALLGIMVAFLYIHGWGVGDTWIFYPPDITRTQWMIPVASLAWSLGVFALLVWNRRRHKTGIEIEPISGYDGKYRS